MRESGCNSYKYFAENKSAACAALIIALSFILPFYACEKKKEPKQAQNFKNSSASAAADKLAPSSFDEPVYEYKIVSSDVYYSVKRLNELASEYNLIIAFEDGFYKTSAPKGVFFSFQKKLASLGKVELYSKARTLPQPLPSVDVWVKIGSK